MPLRPARPDPSDPATRRDLTGRGWSGSALDRAAQRGELVRLLPATYVDATAAKARPVETTLAAVRAHLGPGAVAVLDTAAALHGLPDPWPAPADVHVALRPGREQKQRPGVRFHTWRLRPDEVCVVRGHRVTTVERTLADLMCTYDRLSAVSAVDAALRQRLIGVDDVRRLRTTTVARRGAARSRDWWTEADGRAESPLETRVRLRAVDGGYPPDDLQRRFALDPGVAYVDLAWRMPDGRWLAMEADGASWHSAPDALFVDRRRANRLAARDDVVLVRVVWADTTSPHPVPQVLRAHLGPPRGIRRV